MNDAEDVELILLDCDSEFDDINFFFGGDDFTLTVSNRPPPPPPMRPAAIRASAPSTCLAEG